MAFQWSEGNEYPFNDSRAPFCKTIQIATNRFLTAYKDLGNSGYGTIRPFDINRDTDVFTYGKEFVFHTGSIECACVSTASISDYVLAFATGTSVYFYYISSNTSNENSNINSFNISIVDELLLATGYPVDKVRINKLTSSKFVVSWLDNNNFLLSTIIDIIGGVITPSIQYQTYDGNPVGENGSDVLSSTKLLFSIEDINDGNKIKAYTVDIVNGTQLVPNTVYTLNNVTPGIEGLKVVTANESRNIIIYRDTSSLLGYVLSIPINRDIIDNTGLPALISNNQVEYIRGVYIHDSSDNRYAISYSDLTLNRIGILKILTVVDKSIIEDNSFIFKTTTIYESYPYYIGIAYDEFIMVYNTDIQVINKIVQYYDPTSNNTPKAFYFTSTSDGLTGSKTIGKLLEKGVTAVSNIVKNIGKKLQSNSVIQSIKNISMPKTLDGNITSGNGINKDIGKNTLIKNISIASSIIYNIVTGLITKVFTTTITGNSSITKNIGKYLSSNTLISSIINKISSFNKLLNKNITINNNIIKDISKYLQSFTVINTTIDKISEFNKLLNSNITYNGNIIKNIDKNVLYGYVVIDSTLNRIISFNKFLIANVVVKGFIIKEITKEFIGNISISYGINKILNYTKDLFNYTSVNKSLDKDIGKILEQNVVVSSNNIIKMIYKYVANSIITVSGLISKNISKILNNISVIFGSIVKNIGKYLNNTVVITTNNIKQMAIILYSTIVINSLVLKNITKEFISNITILGLLIKDKEYFKTLFTYSTYSSTIDKNIGKNLLDITNISSDIDSKNIFKVLVTSVTNISANIKKNIIKFAFNTNFSLNSTISKNISKIFNKIVVIKGNIVKHISKFFNNEIVIDNKLTKYITKSFNKNIMIINTIYKEIFKFLTKPIFVSSIIRKIIYKIENSTIVINSNLIKEIIKSFVSNITIKADLNKLISKTFANTLLVYSTISKIIYKLIHSFIVVKTTINKYISKILETGTLVYSIIYKHIYKTLISLYITMNSEIDKDISKTIKTKTTVVSGLIDKLIGKLIEQTISIKSSLADKMIYKFVSTKIITIDNNLNKQIYKSYISYLNIKNSLRLLIDKLFNRTITIDKKKNFEIGKNFNKIITTTSKIIRDITKKAFDKIINIKSSIVFGKVFGKILTSTYIITSSNIIKDINKKFTSSITNKTNMVKNLALELRNYVIIDGSNIKSILKQLKANMSVSGLLKRIIGKILKNITQISVNIRKRVEKVFKKSILIQSIFRISNDFFKTFNTKITTLSFIDKAYVKIFNTKIYINILAIINPFVKIVKFSKNLTTRIVIERKLFKSIRKEFNRILNVFNITEVDKIHCNFGESIRRQISGDRYLASNGDWVRVVYIGQSNLQCNVGGKKIYYKYGGTIYRGLEVLNKEYAVAAYQDPDNNTIKAVLIKINSDDTLYLYEELEVRLHKDKYWDLHISKVDENKLLLTYKSSHILSSFYGAIITVDLENKTLSFDRREMISRQLGQILSYDSGQIDNNNILFSYIKRGLRGYELYIRKVEVINSKILVRNKEILIYKDRGLINPFINIVEISEERMQVILKNGNEYKYFEVSIKDGIIKLLG